MRGANSCYKANDRMRGRDFLGKLSGVVDNRDPAPLCAHCLRPKRIQMRRQSSPLVAASPEYLEELQARFRHHPESVDLSWRVVFSVLEDLLQQDGTATSTGNRHVWDHRALADAVRNRGHLFANLDPLGRLPRIPANAPLEDLAFHLLGDVTRGARNSAAAEVEVLRERYLGPLSVEMGHIDDPKIFNWLVERFETDGGEHGPESRLKTLDHLNRAETFERFLSVKLPTKKRFGAEGAETVVPLLARVIERAALAGVVDIVIGSMHRGRLNIMANVLRQPLIELLATFKGTQPFPVGAERAADVPYHLGFEVSMPGPRGDVSLTLCPNPSHLEAVNSVAMGRVRARQDLSVRSGVPAGATLGIILHTDASVIGQGSVSELIQLGGPTAFSTAGLIHIVINNQIGFTTEPAEARTSRHCTGLWKAVDSAILHVNANDPDAARRAADIAVDFRQAHGRDAVIDLVSYRKNGHNEIDEPRFTQPMLYKDVDEATPVAALYASRLISEGIASPERIEEVRQSYWETIQQAYAAASSYSVNQSRLPNGRWAPYVAAPGVAAGPVTGVDETELNGMLLSLSKIQEGMAVDPKVRRVLSQRENARDKGLTWATAESLAFATVLARGLDIRLTGQDVVRGAYSHRHFTVSDAKTGAQFTPLNALGSAQGNFTVANSPLSEYGVLGFEYGYSLERPDGLVIWEAQFGDFANCAQVIIDQFVTSGEEKWSQPSGLVVLLPHGLEGQGPEHSSARVERILQQCAKDNIRVANPSTPANYFHLLRRQVFHLARKPLFVLSPKTLLRLPEAISPLADFGSTSAFSPILAHGAEGATERVLLCTGKIAYELEAERRARGATNIAIVRLEELYPFPENELARASADWKLARFVWVQEEPANMGPWSYLDRRLEALFDKLGCHMPRASLVSRPESPSPAGSFHSNHERDQRALVEEAFS
jgi:2-oxoglutarate dehydrogenase E1 component